MHQLRWNALLHQWVVVSTHRQERPQMPANWCPFCPGSGHVPENYDVLLYPNDFPAFSFDTEPFHPQHDDPFATTGARGACDVVLYSPNHTLPPSKLTAENWHKIVDLWTRRTAELAANPDVAFVAPFENSGEAIGVTMPHPHGQIYAMPFVPPNIQTELESSSAHAARHGGACLFCHLLAEELRRNERIVAQNDSFVAFVPFAARFPAEVAIYPRRHVANLPELGGAERADLAGMIGIMRRKYDNLYGFLLPLMMLVKQGPFKSESIYHFHVQFLPLQRSATKLKYLASIESGFGTFLADTRPEERAEELRRAEPVS
ncbi:MAG TPA: galactose-1-phosphate uridylyltransferase [Bryobacteraceae bacterium]|nr:galactose-1-phosphate uridylyltransferase [Bryobacteraceae bacterium]